MVQGVRLPLILVALGLISLWHHPGWAAVLFGISIPLPWIAVVIANGRGEPRDPRTNQVYKPAVYRQIQQDRAELVAGQRRELGGSAPREQS